MPQQNNVHRSVRSSAARLRRAGAAGRVHIPTEDHDFLGLRSGDILVWDAKAKPVAGDLISVEPIDSPGRQIKQTRPAIFLAYQSATENYLSENGHGGNGSGKTRARG
ncbi:MAG TPA: hypothetical protein VJX67_00585, partial [Blastocatellia bacterium]|nr:hypothetical protein [Blastocatellia bacterium]